MIDMVETLQVLVCLAVELKVCFQVGLILAQLTNKVASNDNGHLKLPVSSAVMCEMHGKSIQVVTTKISTDTAVEKVVRVLISRLWRWLHAVRAESFV